MATPEPSSLSQRDVARVEAFTIEADPSNDLEEFVSLPESNLMAGPHALRKIWRVSTVTLSGQSSFSPNSAELGPRPSRRYPGGLGDPLFMEQKRSFQHSNRGRNHRNRIRGVHFEPRIGSSANEFLKNWWYFWWYGSGRQTRLGRIYIRKLEPTGRFELPTCCLQNSCSAS